MVEPTAFFLGETDEDRKANTEDLLIRSAKAIEASSKSEEIYEIDTPAETNVLKSDEEIIKTAEAVREVAAQLIPTHIEQALLLDIQDKSVNFIVSLAKEIPTFPSRLLKIIEDNLTGTGELYKRIAKEHNVLAYAILNVLRAFNNEFRDIDGPEKLRILEEHGISDTQLLVTSLEHSVNNYKKLSDQYAILKKIQSRLNSEISNYKISIDDLTKKLEEATVNIGSYTKIVGNIVKFPLRGFSHEEACWVIRHKTRENIYIGLTERGKKRIPNQLLMDFVPLKGLAAAYKVIYNGPLSPPELRDLLEQVAVAKFYVMFDSDDYQIEKITTQIYGS